MEGSRERQSITHVCIRVTYLAGVSCIARVDTKRGSVSNYVETEVVAWPRDCFYFSGFLVYIYSTMMFISYTRDVNARF